MFKRLFSFSNPIGIAVTAAALILTLSPEARKGTRKVLVKGAAALLSVGDQVKQLTTDTRKELGHFVKEAKEEKEQIVLPDFSEMMKNAGESTKTKFNQAFDNIKSNVEKPSPHFAHSMEMGEEFMENVVQNQNSSSAKKTKKYTPKNSNVQNVLSDEAFSSLVGKPPFK